MAPRAKTLTDYERQRLENIRRNEEKMSALMVQRKAADLFSASIKPKGSPMKPKPAVSKGQSPIVQMAPRAKTLTDYERQRLENIRRNEEMMSALMVQRKAADLSSASLKPKCSPMKPKPAVSKDQSPIVLRRSLRIRSIPPNSAASVTDVVLPPKDPPPSISSPYTQEQLLLREAFVAGPHDSDSGLIAAISDSSAGSESGPAKGEGFDPRSDLVLSPENVANLVSERIMSVQFMPFEHRTVLAVGDKIGNLAFWDVNFSDGDGDGIYVYRPHSAPVSGILVHHFYPRKIFTSSYDGFIRLMDVEKESFNMIVSSHHAFYSICQRPNDMHSLYIGEGYGMLKVWDERGGKDSSFMELHGARINTIDFNPENEHLMVTSSTDGFAHLWDLRSMNKDRPESIKSVSHERSVHSAYFSPSGKYLATSSLDDNVGIASGANFEDLTMIPHNNWTGRWLASFRPIWGWDDSYLYMGNMGRAVDVISTSNKTVTALESPEMTSIPCRFAAHPYMLGSLAGATSGGKVFLWTKE